MLIIQLLINNAKIGLIFNLASTIEKNILFNVISEALGHQDIKTTQIYLSRFDNEQVDEAMKNLL